MRTALKNRHEVFHFWANRVQAQGRAGNVYFNDSRVYSYGAHFCIARHLPGGAVAFTTRGYSPSTSKHIHEARSAASHLPIVFCNDPSDTAHENMRHARQSIATALGDAQKPRIRQLTRERLKGQALHYAERANAYLAALPADERGAEVPINTSALEAVRATLQAAEQAAERIRAEQHAARLADLQASLTEWRAHAIIVRTGLHALPPALRLSEDKTRIETSHGAEIPARLAPVIWTMVERARETGADADLTRLPLTQFGHYTLSAIRADGSIVVGCHTIAHSELQGMARQLGLAA